MNNTPNIGPYTELKPFRFWCQKVMPLVYDESLSYYELLCKVVDYLNKTMEDVDNMIIDMQAFQDAYEEFVTDADARYLAFTTNIVEEFTAFKNNTNAAVEELETFMNNYFNNLDVQDEIDNKIDSMAEAGYFDILFARVFADDVVSTAQSYVTAWIAENLLQETGYVIDKSLTIEDAAADAKAAGDKISANNEKITNVQTSAFNGYVYNPNNIFKDVLLKDAETLVAGATIDSDYPSGVIHYSADTDSQTEFVSIDLGTIFQNLAPDITKHGTYYFHFTIKADRNANYAYKNTTLNCYYYGNNSLKGAFVVTFYGPSVNPDENPYTEYVQPYVVDATVADFDEMRFTIRQGFDIHIKDFYITFEEDSTPLYKELAGEVVNNNGLKLAIIGDSLSAADATVNVKYHDLLEDNNDYDVTNCAVSGSSYTNGSLSGGTRNHQFYNQALNVPASTEATLVFGSFNDMSQIGGTFFIYDSSNNVIASGAGGKAPSSSATLLSTDESSAHWFTHNANSDIPAGTYRMVCDGVTYQFTTSNTVPASGKLKFRIVTLGEIGVDDNDTDTIVGAFTTMINNLYTINNAMAIVIVSPTPWILYNNVNPHSAGALEACTAYVAKLKELANHYMLPFMNLYEISNLRPWDATFRSNYYNNADGVHPNNNGHEKYIYPHMREILRTINFKNII